MKQTDADAVAPSHLRDVHALSKALGDDAGFLLATPAPAAVDPADHLDPPRPAAADIYVLRTMMITMRIVFAVHRQPRTRFARRRIIPDQAGRQHVGRSCRIQLIIANGIGATHTPAEARAEYAGYGVEQMADWVGRRYIAPESNVLDVRCGLGRIARSLAGLLTTGSYTGIDITKSSIEYCAEAYREFQNFKLIFADLKNSHYNSTAAVSAASYVFRVPDNSTDYLWSTSVFTHMRIEEIDNYLSEMTRVAKPGSLLWNTILLLDEVSTPLAKTGVKDGNVLKYEIDGGLYMIEGNPDHIVAFYKDRIEALHAKHGLEIVHIVLSDWSGCGPNGRPLRLPRRDRGA
jgi:ubiquinone/menaquinone biosynthesis C-methylase UbiE